MKLYWLPKATNWSDSLKALSNSDQPWTAAVALANSQLDFIQTNALDEVLRRAIGAAAPVDIETKPVRLAILSSCTTKQLHPAIRIGALRRGIHVTTYEVDYGQYWQELTDPGSALHAFRPTTVLFSLDASHLASGIDLTLDAQAVQCALQDIEHRIRECWRLARESFECPIIHQTSLQSHPTVLGNNEHRLLGSKHTFIARLNADLRDMADAEDISLLALDERSTQDGLYRWHDTALWHRAKQEVSPAAAPMYGELVGRLIAAQQGRSYKCLVLDLDNTVWGGVVGDDGLEGLAIGQGSALGEAYTAFQEYVRELSRRGIILAVCSKNDETNAVEPFDKHPEMVLRRCDIASFFANWSDKPQNIRMIAQELNIGLDSLVFFDDNPFERTLVRQELPMVATPEIFDDPSTFPQTLADSGYFEGLDITNEDRQRTGQYQENRLRENLRLSSTDLPSYLRSLEMQLRWRRFDQIGLSRIVQLINKTNQFNLTTRRYTTEDVVALMHDTQAFGLQLRLLDRFGDNGIIAIVIGKICDGDDLLIDTWLMSCRVLGRQVESITLNLVAAQAQSLGAKRLIGEYLPTKKNGMIRDHYSKLGFRLLEMYEGGGSRSVLELAGFQPAETFIDVREG